MLRSSTGWGEDAPFLAWLRSGRELVTYSRHTLRQRCLTACKPLGLERLRGLTIHKGRHTFISHAFADGRTLAEVRGAAGHANVSITSAYLHGVVGGRGGGEVVWAQ